MHISPEIPQNKKKNGARDQVMEKQTVELLKECNSGCKMGINSMNQVREYVMDEKLAKVLKEYDEKHKKLEKETSKLLAEFGKDEKMAATWESKALRKRSTSIQMPPGKAYRWQKTLSNARKLSGMI